MMTNTGDCILQLDSMQKRVRFDPVAHVYTVDGFGVLPSVSELMRPLSSMEYANGDAYFTALAMERGKRAHLAMQAYDTLGVITEEKDIAPYLDGYMKWLSSLPDGFRVIANEQYVFTDQYAGTIDKLIEAPDGKLWLVDVKTGDTARPRLWYLQLEMYRIALAFNEIPIEHAMVLQVKKNGKTVEHLHQMEVRALGVETTQALIAMRNWRMEFPDSEGE